MQIELIDFFDLSKETEFARTMLWNVFSGMIFSSIIIMRFLFELNRVGLKSCIACLFFLIFFFNLLLSFFYFIRYSC